VVILLILVPGSFLLKSLAEQSFNLFLIGKERIATGIFQDCGSSLCTSAKGIIQGLDLKLQLQDSLKLVTTWVIDRGSAILTSLPKFLLNLFVVFFTMFYFLKDGTEFSKKVSDVLSMQEKKHFFIVKRLKEIIHGLVFGYVLVAIIQGTLGAIGFAIFGVPSPLFWGVIMIFLALIPALGTGLVWLPASLILFLDGIFQDSNGLIIRGILLLVYSIIFVASIDNVLKPKLVSAKAKIHPAIIMVGIFGGLFFFGMWGVILGPLILSLTTVFMDVFFLERTA
jgi:predicted PurR-regulated permease PerM